MQDLLDVSVAEPDDRPLDSLLGSVAAAAVRGSDFGAALIRTRLPDLGGEHSGRAGDATRVAQLDALSTSEAAADLHVRHVTAAPDGLALAALPIVVRGTTVGGVYLAARGVDEELGEAALRTAESIAQVAAGVVERARVTEENHRRQRWSAAGARLTKDIVAGLHDDPLQEVAERVLDLADANDVLVVQHGAAEDTFVIAAAAGEKVDKLSGQVFVAHDSVTADVMVSGRPALVTDVLDRAAPELSDRLTRDHHGVAVPLMGSGMQRGVLWLLRSAGRGQFSESDIAMASMFAGTVALALELAESQRRRDRIALVEERDRIARDLHDHVIQRLYAIGLSIQNVTTKVTGDAEARLSTSVDELDETIKQIRSTIYQLTKPLAASEVALRARAEALVADLTPVLGFAPRLTAHGAVEFGIDEQVADDCIAVLREALSNVARHAHATQVEVIISVSPATVRVEVRDDGRGVGEVSRRSGLANLRARAERRGGFMQVRSSPGSGTWMLWSVPIEGAVAPVGQTAVAAR